MNWMNVIIRISRSGKARDVYLSKETESIKMMMASRNMHELLKKDSLLKSTKSSFSRMLSR